MLYVGVDPGAGGGIAVVNEAGAAQQWTPMPETERDVLDWLQLHVGAEGDGRHRAVLEKVSATPQMGVSSAFSFGRNVGGLRMALVAASLPFDEVPAVRWQKALGCRSGGDKNVTKRRAQELFPSVKVTHAVADALLLAEYCRRVALGQLAPDEQREKVAQHPLNRRRAAASGSTDLF